MAQHKRANESNRGTFETSGGQTYLENLRKILPDAQVDQIVKNVERDDENRRNSR